MRELRRADRRVAERPVLLAGGAASALATVLALLAFAVIATRLWSADSLASVAVALLAGTLAYEAVHLATKAALLPAVYAMADAAGALEVQRGDDSRRDRDGTERGEDDSEHDDPEHTDSEHDDPNPGELVAVGLALARRRYVDVLDASVRARLATAGYAVLLAPALLGIVGLLATVATALGYAVGLPDPPRMVPYTVGLLGVAVLLRGVAAWPTALTEALAASGVDPRRAWRESAALAIGAPRTAGAAAAQRLLLGGAFVGAIVGTVALGRGVDDVVVGATLVAASLVGSATKTIEAVLVARVERSPGSSEDTVTADGDDASTMDRDDGRESGAPDGVSALGPLPAPSVLAGSTARVGLAVLLVVALIAGSGAVRVADVRPATADAGPTADDAAAVLDDAGSSDGGELGGSEDDLQSYVTLVRERTTAGSRTVTVDTRESEYERSEPAWEPSVRTEQRVHHRERRADLRLWIAENGSYEPSGEAYATDGVYASRGVRHDLALLLGTRNVDGWTVSAAPGYTWLLGFLPPDYLPAADLPWRIVERDEDAVVLAADEPAAVADVGRLDDGFRFEAQSAVRVRIDAQDHRIDRITVRERAVNAHDGEVYGRYDLRTTVEYEHGEPAIDRPAAADHPLEFLWDAVYY